MFIKRWFISALVTSSLALPAVNGNVTFEENDCTGVLPGKLLRSYDMVG